MAGKTHGDKIDDLSKLAAALTERVDNVRTEIGRFDQKVARVIDQVTALETRVTLLVQQFGDVQEANRERGRKIWSIVGPILGAVVGAGITVILTYLLRN